MSNKENKAYIEKLKKDIEDLQGEKEELEIELKHVKEEFEEYKQVVLDNYKPISPYEMYDVNENDFH